MEGKFIHQYILAYAVVICYAVVTGILLFFSFRPAPMQDQTGSVFMLLGGLSSALGMVMMYFFGSTRGSGEKTDAMVKMAEKIPPPKPKEQPCPPEGESDAKP